MLSAEKPPDTYSATAAKTMSRNTPSNKTVEFVVRNVPELDVTIVLSLESSEFSNLTKVALAMANKVKNSKIDFITIDFLIKRNEKK